MNYYDQNSVGFVDDATYLIKEKGSMKLTENILCDNVYYVEGLNYNLVNASQLNSSGCKIEFENKFAKIYDIDGKLMGKR